MRATDVRPHRLPRGLNVRNADGTPALHFAVGHGERLDASRSGAAAHADAENHHGHMPAAHGGRTEFTSPNDVA